MRSLFLWAILLPITQLCAQETRTLITGNVLQRTGEPIPGATISLLHSSGKTVSGDKGDFAITLSVSADTLLVQYIGYASEHIPVNTASAPLKIVLRAVTTEVQDVIVSTGYQQLVRGRSTGSYDMIGKELVNRSVSSNIIDRIENLSPGTLVNHGDAAGTDPLLIRGRSTMYAAAAPLIVLDNFPYDGSIDNINPNDVESVTILKDAAAASIWGARAGNGVIVITTKRGRTAKPSVEFTSSVTRTAKPDLYSTNALGSADEINFETGLYNNGYYKNTLADPRHLPVSSVIELLDAVAKGKISQAEADQQIAALKGIDTRADLGQYFYKPALNFQQALNVSGSTSFVNYYFSAGWDRGNSVGNLAGTQSDRITIRTQETFKLSSQLDITAGLNFVDNSSQVGNNPGVSITGLRPYTDLVSDAGQALIIDNRYRPGFTDTATAGGKLYDWKYRPYDDIGATATTNRTKDYLVNLGLRYSILHSLSAEVKYQYENSVTDRETNYSEQSFTVRDMVNNFYQPATNSFPVPKGAILDFNHFATTSHQGRAQLNYQQTFKGKHALSAVGGWEIKSYVSGGNSSRLYGYTERGSLVNTRIDYITSFPQYSNPAGKNTIGAGGSVTGKTDRFVSMYANAAYTFDGRISLSASARNDAANLFGVSTNQKGVPLWSAGAAWELSREHFWHAGWLPYLKLRATYGYNGNFSRLASALTTVSFAVSQTTGQTSATIQNPPNAGLRWEQVRIANFGADFGLFNRRLTGTLEYYRKHSVDLIAPAPLDPTLGFPSSVYQNTASMKGQGVDLELNSLNIKGRFQWRTNFLFSYANSEVATYLVPVSTNAAVYVSGEGKVNPVIGRPLFVMNSYRWAGLDHAAGNPMGYVKNDKSMDYTTITSKSTLDDLVYNGTVQPRYFGALRNTFSYRGFSLSFNISYKLGYVFRAKSIDYGALASNWYMAGSGDYAQRWQQPGDETRTQVPSMVYPLNSARDNFYRYAEVLVYNAGNIRLEDIRLDYTFDKSQMHRLPFRQATVFLYLSNLGPLWLANSKGIDPYYNGTPVAGKQISLGLHVSF